MASPARTPPAGNQSDEALDILRRLEPVLAKLDERQRKQGEDIAELKGLLKSVALKEDVARVDGRLVELSARVPSIWTLAALIVSLFGASFVLIRFASGH
jgi:hypothetical protein